LWGIRDAVKKGVLEVASGTTGSQQLKQQKKKSQTVSTQATAAATAAASKWTQSEGDFCQRIGKAY